MKLTRRAVILAKLEGAYGVDAAPTGADAILCNSGVDVKPQGEVIERDVLRDTLSPSGHVIGAKTLDFDFSVELKGGGLVATAVQAPEYDALLQSCGMAQQEVTELTLSEIPTGLATGDTITDDTSGAHGTVAYIRGLVVGLTGVSGGEFAINDEVNTNAATIAANPAEVLCYAPISDPELVKSCTVLFYKDGILHKSLGVRGSFDLNAPSGKYGTLKFTMHGLWTDPVDQAAPAPQILDLFPPVCVGAGLKIGIYSPVGISALSLNLAADVVKRPDLNAAEGVNGLVIKGRKPTGSLDPEVQTLAAFNPWTAWKNASTAAIHARFGQTSGNSVEVHVPKAQYSEVKYADRDNVAIYNLAFTCTVDHGDDEFRLIYK
jgi:hypothetical protein